MSLSVVIAVVMAVVWCLVIGEISLGQAILGLLFGALFVLATGAGRGSTIPLARLPRRLLYLAIYVLLLVPYDVARSNLDLSRRLLRPRPAIRPAIIRVRLESVPPAASALVAHAVTISPGQMVVDYAEDGRTLYVHVIDITDVETREAAFWRLYRRVLQRVIS